MWLTRYTSFLKFFAIFLLPVIVIFFASPEISYSKKKTKYSKRYKKTKRTYNPEKTKQEALQILNSSNANYLVRLANGEIDESEFILDSLIIDQGEDPIELEYEDDKPIDLDVFRAMYLSYIEGDDFLNVGGTLSSGISKKKIMEVILDWLGTPYYFGGTTDRGIDCSAFTRQIYFTAAKILLPRTAKEQIKVGIPVKRDKLEFGDLVFFHTRRNTYVSHVGIYLGDNLFAHSSSRYGVTVSSLESKYYSSRFIGARRLTFKDVANLGQSN
ncbi:MAG: NlpC/P60 family protein [Ignavibacteria bacterium]|nr:NlpC/P60 family protein [Ignavibacteria bacterium]